MNRFAFMGLAGVALFAAGCSNVTETAAQSPGRPAARANRTKGRRRGVRPDGNGRCWR
jgi:hypothetical protein